MLLDRFLRGSWPRTTRLRSHLDLGEELRLAPLLAKLRTRDAAAVFGSAGARAATRGGADALWIDVDTLEPGRGGDLVLLDLDDAVFVPLVEDCDLVSHLVWSAGSGSVADVSVDGRRVVEGGTRTTVDQERARREVQDRAARFARAA